MNICHTNVHTVRVPVLSISSCVCFYVSVPGLSMNICGSVKTNTRSDHFTVRVPVLSISSCVCFYVVPGLSMNICVSVSFYCSCSSSQTSVLVFVFPQIC